MKIRCGIFTTDREFAKFHIDTLKNNHGGNVTKYIYSVNDISCYMDDGTNYVWLRPNLHNRGYRCSQAVIDISTCDFKEIKEIIIPICLYADKEDFTIVRSKEEDMNLFDFIKTLEKIAILKGNISVFYNDCDSCPNFSLGFNIEKDGLNLYG